MLILTLEPSTSAVQGDQIYRTHQPSQALAKFDHIYTVSTNWLHPQAHTLAEIADVLVLCQSIDIDFLPLMQRRRNAKRLTVVEFNDDFLNPDPKHTVATFYRDPINRSLALQMGGLADRLQFSSYHLAKQFGHLNPHHAVFPNALHAEKACPPNERKATKRLALGWAGSAGHYDDLAWLVPTLQRILARFDLVDLHIMGDPKLQTLFHWVPSGRFYYRPVGDFSAYQRFLSSLDVGVAPLRDTAFNRSRSDVKYLEYTSQGVVGIFSNSPAYQGSVQHNVTGLLADTQADFETSIAALLTDSNLRKRLVDTAQKAVFQHRTAAAMARARLDFWGQKATPDTYTMSKQHLQTLGLNTGIAYHRLPKHRTQTLLHQGLSTHWRDGYPLLLQAIEHSPTFYLPYLYAGSRHPDLQTSCHHLQQALAQNPASVATRYHLAEKMMQQKAYRRAHEVLGSPDITSSNDQFAPSLELKGRLALAEGQSAENWFQAALQANPWYRLPATRRAQLLLEQGQTDKAQKLLQDNLTYDRHWLDSFLLGQIAIARQAWLDGQYLLESARAQGGPMEHLGPWLAKAYVHLGRMQTAKQLLAEIKQTAEARTS